MSTHQIRGSRVFNKKKGPSFKEGDIVRHGKRFGYVVGVDCGIDVHFPDPNDDSSGKDVNFARGGSLLGEGEQTLFKHESRGEALASYARVLSCKVQQVDIRIMNDVEEKETEELENYF